jgi:5-deoxy-5-amino-3-dehydroquinate synthase
VLLVGMMGTGKSTVARLLADALGYGLIDTDGLVEARAGRTVAEIFEQDGEPHFRAAEARAIAELAAMKGPLVVSVGGGAVLAAANRRAMRALGTVVWLRAHPATLAERVGAGHDRPLLSTGSHDSSGATAPHDALVRLDGERRALYEEVAEVVVDVDDLSAPQVARRVADALVPVRDLPVREVTVDLGPRSYPVLVGPGARHALSSVVPANARRVAVVTQAGINVAVEAGIEQRTFLIGDGEQAKGLATIEELCRGFAQFGLTRADLVVGLGGGVVTDVAGFAAAVYHRGVAVAQVATTLLGQVDAAIGGKTGVNLPEGKNLVGAFWQPVAVLCDTDVLSSLPPREYRSGLGEMAKYAFLGVPDLAGMDLVEAVTRCVECKAALVSEDERETGALPGAGGAGGGGSRGGRALLNYGHTLAHALETEGRYDLRHGEAVAVGLVFAARLARRLGRVGDERVAVHDRLVAAYDLPSRLPPGVDAARVVALMGRDKKATGGGLTFVLDGPEGLEVVPGVRPDDVLATLAELRQGASPR